MAAGLPPVTKEQAFLETFFQCINSFAYDKAKEKAEKEKDLQKFSPASPIWVSMVTSVTSLSAAEKEYASLLFLGNNLSNKFFGRKDSLRHSYTYLQNDFKTIEENANKAVKSATPNSDTSLDGLLGHLCGQLCQYISARLKTLEFFEQMCTLSQYKNISYEDLLVVITEIIQEHQKDFHHPILSPLKSSFSWECDIISHLLQAQIQIQHCQFFPSLLSLNEAHTRLTTWGSVISQKETKSSLFSGSSKQPVPMLYQWLLQFKSTLMSKFTLYFYDVLSKQGTPTDVKALTAKTGVDFTAKIYQFHKKSDAYCTSLVFDTNGLPAKYQFKGLGYHHPNHKSEKLTGLESYPAVFSYPGVEKADKHWPGVISIMTDRNAELNTLEKIVCFCDDKIQSTYFMTRIEPRMTFVIIFECKKSEKDSYVVNFINELCSHLRCTKLFASLKSGIK